MKFGKNLVVGIIGTAWTGLVGFLVVPIYLRYLGISSYGLIGFFATTQALIQLMDMGLAPTMNREIARYSASDQLEEGRRLLHTLAVVYFATAIILGLLICALAPFIVQHWLRSSEINPETLTRAVMLMGLVVACRWPVALYQGALMGMQRLIISSSVSAVMVTLANAGAVAVLALISPTVEAFFLWQAAVAFLQVAVMRRAAWDVIGRANERSKFDPALLRRIWRFSAGMSGIAIASILLTQLDKILLSKMLSLEDFGKYALAGVVASALYILLTPTFNVVYPRMATLVIQNDESALLDLYKIGTRTLVSVLLPIALSMALYSHDVVQVWTGNYALANTVSPLVSLLVLGTACNGVMHFPYALQLAYGRTRLALTITILLAVGLVPLITILTLRYGAIGSAAAWLSVNITYVLLGTWMTHRTILKGHGASWLMFDVGMPLLVSFLITYLGWLFFRVDGQPLRNLCVASGIGIAAIIVNGLALPANAMMNFRRSGHGW